MNATYVASTQCVVITEGNGEELHTLPYGPAGHCCVVRHETLRGRYLTLFPLGYGGEGQVWLCRDLNERYADFLGALAGVS